MKSVLRKIIREEINKESSKYPTKKDAAWLLRNNFRSRVKYPILDIFIIGSEAKGTAGPDSDLDVAVIIPYSNRITALKRTENYHQKFTDDWQKPKWNGRIVDFQFFYADDPELKSYKKIHLV